MQVFGQDWPFFPLAPEKVDIWIETIAHALANQCRFGGHTRRFYSVAQHCVLVSAQCPNHPLEGLFHDAAETYLGDIIKPLKVLFPEYLAAEERLEKLIAEIYDLQHPWPPEVKAADLVLLATEKRDLMEPNCLDWGPLPEPLPSMIIPWSPEVAREIFLERASELFSRRP